MPHPIPLVTSLLVLSVNNFYPGFNFLNFNVSQANVDHDLNRTLLFKTGLLESIACTLRFNFPTINRTHSSPERWGPDHLHKWTTGYLLHTGWP